MMTLAQRFPDKRFAFVMGGDVLNRIMTWNDPTTGEMTGTRFLNQIPCLVFGRATVGDSGDLGDSGALTAAPSAKGSRVLADIDEVAAVHDLFRRTGLPRPVSDFSYTHLSSTRIREELARGCPDRQFMLWALGKTVLERLCGPGAPAV